MVPLDLKPEHFKGYSPSAKELAVRYIVTFRQLPLSLLPSLLKEVLDSDLKFPIELRTLQRELAQLASLPPQELENWFQEFRAIHISAELENSNWASAPAEFVERLSAYLWSTHQLASFRTAAMAYADRLNKAVPSENPLIPRLGISIIGRGAIGDGGALFRKLRAEGAYFSAVNPGNGVSMLLEAAADRANAHPVAYGHWYIDGGQAANHSPSLTAVAYDSLLPARKALLRKIEAEINRPGMGPEALRSSIARISDAEINPNNSQDRILEHFSLKLLTEGSGTQIFSTTFVQWAAREALRRAQPLTLVARFGPRQKQKTMNELLSLSPNQPELDTAGSLVDADMGAYYNWLNQQRLPGTAQSSFIAWFEDHTCAVAIGPSIPRGTESKKTIGIKELLAWVA